MAAVARAGAMTEAEWLACGEPAKMLDFMRTQRRSRKALLFSDAYCRAVWDRVCDRAAETARVRNGSKVSDERVAHAVLLRCIVGNPFRPAAFHPAWRSVATVAIAHAIYDQRRFQELPVLADALEEAGCDNAEL